MVVSSGVSSPEELLKRSQFLCSIMYPVGYDWISKMCRIQSGCREPAFHAYVNAWTKNCVREKQAIGFLDIPDTVSSIMIPVDY